MQELVNVFVSTWILTVETSKDDPSGGFVLPLHQPSQLTLKASLTRDGTRQKLS